MFNFLFMSKQWCVAFVLWFIEFLCSDHVGASFSLVSIKALLYSLWIVHVMKVSAWIIDKPQMMLLADHKSEFEGSGNVLDLFMNWWKLKVEACFFLEYLMCQAEECKTMLLWTGFSQYLRWSWDTFSHSISCIFLFYIEEEISISPFFITL